MKTKRTDFLIEPKPKKMTTSVEVDQELYKRAKLKMKANGVTLHKLVEHAMIHYLNQI